VTMKADPLKVWDLVSDVTRIGEYSPETFGAEWLDGATSPAVGNRFRGHVRRYGRGPLVYWTECKVVIVGGRPTNTWRYDLAAGQEAGTTDVTESFQLAAATWSRVYWALAGWLRGRANESRPRSSPAANYWRATARAGSWRTSSSVSALVQAANSSRMPSGSKK
jgi:hypothetical protein